MLLCKLLKACMADLKCDIVPICSYGMHLVIESVLF